MPKDKKNRIYPFPELLPGGEGYGITDTDAHSYRLDHTRKNLALPLGDSVLDHTVRLRAQAHIQWGTPFLGTSASKASHNTLKAVEELRITHLLQREADLPSTKAGYIKKDIAKIMLDDILEGENSLKKTVLFTVGNGRTLVGDYLQELLEKSDVKEAKHALIITKEALDMMERSQDMSADDRIEIAEHVEKRIQDFTEKPKKKEEPQANQDQPGNTPSLNRDQEKKIEEAVEDGIEPMLKGNNIVDKNMRGRWAEMKTEKPSLYHHIKPRMIERKVKSSEEGSFVRDITRTLTDQKVFGTVSRKQGGSVLIDCSSSMSLTKAHIEGLVKTAPAVTVALYSGDSSKNTGVLRIVVANGRMCDDNLLKSPGGGGNCIDGLAIRHWLVLQGEPRIWVSDGLVTGVGDNGAPNLLDEVISLMRHHRVIRLGNVPDALKFFMEISQGRGYIHPTLAHRNAREMKLFGKIK